MRQWGEIYLKMLVIARLINIGRDPTVSPFVADLSADFASVGAWGWASGCGGIEGHLGCVCAISDGLGQCFGVKFNYRHKHLQNESH